MFLTFIRDVIGFLVFFLAMVVSVISWFFHFAGVFLFWLRMTLYIEAARLMAFPKAELDSLYRIKLTGELDG